MKKWLVLALGMSVAGLASAQDGGQQGGGPQGEGQGGGEHPRMEQGRKAPPPLTLERFIQHEKRMAKKKGEEFDQAAAEAKFAQLDKNKDGVLTPDEFKPERKKQRERMGEGGPGGDDEGAAPPHEEEGDGDDDNGASGQADE